MLFFDKIFIHMYNMFFLFILRIKYPRNLKLQSEDEKKKIFFNKNSEILIHEDGHVCIGNHFYARRFFTLECVKGNLSIGKYVFFNRFCSVTVFDNVEIGDYCIFGENVKIYDHNHTYNLKDKLIKDSPLKSKEIILGKNIWVGSNSIILMGVKIGDNSVIGANSVIYKDVPANVIHFSDGNEKRIMRI